MYANLLERKGINLYGRSTGKLKTYCPRCQERKGRKPSTKDLSVNISDGWWKCHSSSCDFSGNVLNRESAKYERPTPLPNDPTIDPKLISFGRSRAISPATIKKLRWSVEKGAICFNYFFKGERVNYKRRIVTEEGDKTFRQHKNAEKFLYNIDSCYHEDGNIKKKVIWVEGEMDVAAFVEAGLDKEYGVISIDQGAAKPGQTLGDKLKCIEPCAEILASINEHYFCLDQDAPGQYTQKEIIRRIGEYKCKVVKLPKGKKDANDVLMDKTLEAKMNHETLKLCIQQAYQVVPEGAYRIDEDEFDKYMEEFDKEPEKGYEIGFMEIDSLFKFFHGEMTFLYGWPNSGKGTFVRYLMVFLAVKYDWKWAIFAGEDGDASNVVNMLMGHYLGKDVIGDKRSVTKEEYRKGLEFIKEHFYFVLVPQQKGLDTDILPTNEWINGVITYLTLKYGVNAWVKDPWFYIHHDMQGMREDQYLRQELTREIQFCKKYSAALYVDHPLNEDKRSAIKKIRPRPTPGLLRGGGMKHIMTDNLLCMHRLRKGGEDMGVEFTADKIRFQQLGQRKVGSVVIGFDRRTQRYVTGEGQFDPLSTAIKERDGMELINIGDEDLPF